MNGEQSSKVYEYRKKKDTHKLRPKQVFVAFFPELTKKKPLLYKTEAAGIFSCNVLVR
jgi:hypothetical protein